MITKNKTKTKNEVADTTVQKKNPSCSRSISMVAVGNSPGTF